MSKHLKTFLIITISIFSFLFFSMNDVEAVILGNADITSDFITSSFNNYYQDKGKSGYKLYDIKDFPYVFCYLSSEGSSNGYSYTQFYCYYSPNIPTFTVNSSNRYTVNINDYSNFYNEYGQGAPSFYAEYWKDSFGFLNTSTRWGSTNFTKSNLEIVSNFDIYINGELFQTKNLDYNPSKDINVTFHLNGGDVYNKNQECDETSCGLFTHEYNDFTVTLNSGLVYSYLKNLEVNKDMMVFKGWYYDNTFNNPITESDVITSNIDLYAKYEYASVDDFLKNVSFTEHTFDIEYDYAIISKGDFDDDIYLGLNFADYSLEVYEYRPDLSSYKDGPTVCLTPVYIKDGKYYYNVNTLYTSNYEIFVLPRSVFDKDVNTDYKFLLTNNAYVKYTNDLSDSIIVDKNGNEIHTNLKDSYELGQSYLNEYNNTDSNFNLIKKYLNELKSINSVWNECFDLFYRSLPSIVRSFLIFVFNIFMILIFLKLVGWK